MKAIATFLHQKVLVETEVQRNRDSDRDSNRDRAMGGGGAGELPVTLFAGEIVAQVREHPVVVIIGETGSGKTTQISQILYRAHFAQTGTIAITHTQNALLRLEN